MLTITNPLHNLVKSFDKRSPMQKAVDWIKAHRIPNSGITVHHKTKMVTP